MTLHFYQKVIAFMGCMLLVPLATAAGFSCESNKLTKVESFICEDADLNLADEEMVEGYRSLLKALPKDEAELLPKDQQKWLKERNKEINRCLTPAGQEDCRALYLYAQRIAQLGPPKEAGFDCKKAGTAAEKKICNSRLLRHADGCIVKLYQERQEEFKEDQRAWLKERNKELANKQCDTACAWEFYKDRIVFFVHQSF